MADERIQYTTTTDGVTIAMRVTGGGPGIPLVYTHSPGMSLLSPLAVRLRNAMVVDPIQFITGRPLAVFDFRGAGLSERRVTDMSMQQMLLDLQAVVDSLGWSKFSLGGLGMAGPIMIAYAAKHPDWVASLVLRETYARASDLGKIPRMRIHAVALREDWDTYVELMVNMTSPWAPEAPAVVEAMKEAIDRDVMMALAAATRTYDASAFVGALDVRTLVIGREDMPVPSPEMLRQLGARIRNARVVLVGGGTAANRESYRVIGQFLAEGDSVELQDTRAQSGFRTVLVTDLVDHTEMMSRLGDERGREVLRQHEGITRDVLKEHGGTEVKTMGDGFMASFGSVTKAVQCAVALQRRIEAWNVDRDPAAGRLSVRIGLDAGEPIEDEGDLFGATVILASRIAARADGGTILSSDVVRGLCSGKGFLFSDRGEFAAKGLAEPVRAFEIAWRK